MNKRIVIILAACLSYSISAVHALNKQDTLLMQNIVNHEELIKGMVYILQAEKQDVVSEFDRSPFVKSGETPVFGYHGIENSVEYAVLGNHPVTYNGVIKRWVELKGRKEIFRILSFTCNGEQYEVYELDDREITDRLSYKLTELALQQQLEKELVGKTLYTQTSHWLKYHKEHRHSNLKYSDEYEQSRKYYPVTITRIENSYDNYFTVFFTDNQGEEYCFINCSFFGYRGLSSGNFSTMLTFENPKIHYPNVSGKRWEQIQSQKVEKGFSKEEVTIAYGKPDEIITLDGNETWIYYHYHKKDIAIEFSHDKVKNVMTHEKR